MAFWGVEVKPGKPYSHRYDETSGRLRVTQATLGKPVRSKSPDPTVTLSRTTVQCNVGEKSPVLICSLVSGTCETCRMELEFEEQEEVVFSVLGQTSVHLTGYYVGSRDGTIEPYGEDIAETESDDSDYIDLSEEDEYESDFIDDGDDIEMYDDDDDNMYAPSRPRKTGVVIEEIFEEEKPSNGDKSRLSKKKNREVSDSDDAAGESQHQLTAVPASSVQVDSEDEDGFPISELKKNEEAKEETKKRKVDESVPKVDEKTGEDNQVLKKNKLDKKSKKKEKSEKESLPSVNAEDVAEENAQKNGSEKPKEETKEPTKVDAEQEDTPVSKKMNDIENGQSADTSQKESKKKKKQKNKKSGEKDQDKNEKDGEIDEKEPQRSRTFGNGLVVEEISMGQPDGKKATPGTKVFVNYIGKLKNGKIFDSNVGQRPFKFRLGVGQVIKGWDVGVNGMRVGDKRRLTIPPAMGYGDKAAADGYEMSVGVNHLGHFLLARLLLEDLQKSDYPSKRLIIVGSITGNTNTLAGNIPPKAGLGDLRGLQAGLNSNLSSMIDGGSFDGAKAYKDSKICNMLTMQEFHRRFHEETGITFASLYPGCIATTGLFREHIPLFRALFPPFQKFITKGFVSEAESGKRLAQVVSEPSLTKSGVYWSWNKDSASFENQLSEEASDAAKARKLWEVSEKLVGLA